MAFPSGLVLAAATFVLVANAAKIPSTWKTCKRSLPPAEYEPCIRNAVTGALDELISKGAPNLHIPALEPLKIPAISIGQGTGPVAVDIKFWDVDISNLPNYQLVNIRYTDVGKYKFGADVQFSKPLVWKSKYELTGKVLVLPIKGKGDCKIDLDNPRVQFNFAGTPYKKGGDTYMNLTDLQLDFDVNKLHLQFENLFDGNKELGDNMNVFLNENWFEILKELKPAFSEGLGLAFKNVAAQIFNSVAYKKLLPE